MSFSSAAGYRSVQSNRGTYFGTWFFEIDVTYLGPTGHCRLGIGTARQEIDAPCGYTEASFGYRDVDGSKVHQAWRDRYGVPYKEGDTVGYGHLRAQRIRHLRHRVVLAT
jgi:Set1/Ash2 histone methyltransferase complex subunit ASH2